MEKECHAREPLYSNSEVNDYGSSTKGTNSESSIERLSKPQKRAERIILNAPYDTASSIRIANYTKKT